MRGSIGRLALAAIAGVVLAAAAGCSGGSHSPAAAGGGSTLPGSAGTAPGSAGRSAAPSGPAGPSQRSSAKPRPATRTGKPGSSNTGALPGTKLVVVSGDRTYSTAGTVISGKDFHGFVTVTGRNITFRNCVFRGGTAAGNAALLDTQRGTGTVVQ
ncbi:MAG: hypothetical protein J2P15_18790, partial [Micromonosporaceae bacterium]|nr:hypothetical protein [Micromonosporaceae bacterium]